MSQIRCNEFMNSHKVNCLDAMRTRVVTEFRKRRQNLIMRLREASYVAPPESVPQEEVTMKDINECTKTSLVQERVYEQILCEKAPPELTADEINEMVAEMDKAVEGEYDIDYSLFSLYMYENQPICPYCNAILTFFDGNLYCEANNCINLHFTMPIKYVEDVAWQMKNIHDSHADTGCRSRLEFLLSPTSPDFVFADCEKCKYLNYVKLR